MLTAHSYSPQLKLKWQRRKSAPNGVIRGAGVAYHNTIYCMSDDSHTVYQYLPDEDEWQEHSHCPHNYTGLAIIKDLLTAVGGKERDQKTNKVLSWRDGRWEEVFPPMNTARWDHAVVTADRYIIAVGGGGGETSVELFIIASNTWSTVTSLPQPLRNISATLSCDMIYAMGREGQTFSLSLSHWTKNTSREPPPPNPSWHRLPDAPWRCSSLSSVSDEVLAVGGLRDTITSDIYQWHNREWVRIG